MKARVVAKAQRRAKTLPEDRSGEDACRREDTWSCEDTSRRQVGIGHVSSRRHMGVRSHEDRSGWDTCRREDTWVCEVTSRRQVGRVKARVVAKTHGLAKTLPEHRSGEPSTRALDFGGGWRLQSFGEGEENSRSGFRGREIEL